MSAANEPFTYGLNTSTIRGAELSLPDEINLCAEAGYDGIEPWIRELDAYVAGGGSLADLARRTADRGLAVPNAIGFFAWIVDDADARCAGLEEARRNFEMCAAIGCERLAAPPFGATDAAGLDLRQAAERYAELCRIGAEFGVTPMVEFWGASRCLSRLGEAMLIAVESGCDQACVLADVYHMYKGGSPAAGLAKLSPGALGLLHYNDYPADPPRETIADADRVYPGDGVAPLATFVRCLDGIGYRGMLSLELFNEAYYRQGAAEVARTGLEKMRATVAAALAE